MRKERLEPKQERFNHLPPTPTVQTPLVQRKKKALTMAEKGHSDKSEAQRERVAIAPWLTPHLLRSWGICFFNGTSRRTWLKEYDTKPMTEILNFLCCISELWRGRALPLTLWITHRGSPSITNSAWVWHAQVTTLTKANPLSHQWSTRAGLVYWWTTGQSIEPSERLN